MFRNLPAADSNGWSFDANADGSISDTELTFRFDS